jgi:hypothetical protein
MSLLVLSFCLDMLDVVPNKQGYLHALASFLPRYCSDLRGPAYSSPATAWRLHSNAATTQLA